MVKVTIDRELAYELVDAKVDLLNKEIEGILKKLNYDDAGKFLSDVQYGEIEDAETYAKDIRGFLDKVSFLVSLKAGWEELDDENFEADFEYQELSDDDEIDLTIDEDAIIDDDSSGDYIEIDDYDSENEILTVYDEEDELWGE